MSVRYNSISTLIKSGTPFFCLDIIYMIYLDVKYFLVVCVSIYYEKLAVKSTLTTVEHFLAKKLNFCLSNIIWNSVALKCQCFKHTAKFLIHIFCTSNTLWRELSSARLDLGHLDSYYSQKEIVYEFTKNNNFFSCKQKLLLYRYL